MFESDEQLKIHALTEVKATDKKTRAQYLIDKVFHRYRNGNKEFERLFLTM